MGTFSSAWVLAAMLWAAPATAGVTRNLVIVTVDGTRWQDVFDARAPLPNLQRLMREGVTIGVRGAPISATGPRFVSLPGYEEIFTGRAPHCRDNGCRRAEGATLLDELRAADAVAPDGIAVVASWERLERVAAHGAITVSAGRHGGAGRDRLRVDAAASQLLDDAAAADAAPGDADYRPDRFTAPLALAYLQARRPRLLVVGLGDTDEHAHHGDYAAYLAALVEVDRFLGQLTAALATLGDYGAATTVLVTADHGRADGFVEHGPQPESARVWLVGWGGAVPARGAIAMARPTWLRDVAPTARRLLGLPADPSPRAGAPIVELLPAPAFADLR